MNTKLLELAIEIQQIPAPTFSESLRADFVKAKFIEEGLADVSQDEVGNVYARLAGSGTGQPLVAVAHLDTVFPIETDLETRRELGKVFGPRLGNNSLGIAALFDLVWLIRQRKLKLSGDL